MNAQSTLLEDARQKFRNAVAYTLEIAELMPADQYGFRPTPEQKSFQEQLIHLLKNACWLSGTYLTDQAFEIDWKAQEGKNKAETIELLTSTFQAIESRLTQLRLEDLDDEVEFFTPELTHKGQILTLLNDHHTHHRGQIIVYLRLQDIAPPRYRGW